jgi:methionine-gamma-lyase
MKGSNKIQDLQIFGEFGGVNPSISDSATFTFMKGQTMTDTFEGETEGCYLYSRHTSPSTMYLSQALAEMEGSEAAHVTGSGMGAITSVLMHLCKSGDHIVSSRTIYGGSYAFMKYFLPKYEISTDFVDITNLDQVEASITENTKVLYCETVSNPLLEVADIEALSKIAKKNGIQLVVDNTFTPLIVSPLKLGADIVVHSLTKFINGMNDAVAGVICASSEFIDDIKNVNDGAAMLLGPTLDALRAASIYKNMRTLDVRMRRHSENAAYLSEKLSEMGLRVVYPGLENHKGYDTLKKMKNKGWGCSGLMTVDFGSKEKAFEMMERMQAANVGYLAVSLGFSKTLFSASGSSTSSEITEEEQMEMGLTEGLVRFSIGLDSDIELTLERIKSCVEAADLMPSLSAAQ